MREERKDDIFETVDVDLTLLHVEQVLGTFLGYLMYRLQFIFSVRILSWNDKVFLRDGERSLWISFNRCTIILLYLNLRDLVCLDSSQEGVMD